MKLSSIIGKILLDILLIVISVWIADLTMGLFGNWLVERQNRKLAKLQTESVKDVKKSPSETFRHGNTLWVVVEKVGDMLTAEDAKGNTRSFPLSVLA